MLKCCAKTDSIHRLMLVLKPVLRPFCRILNEEVGLSEVVVHCHEL
jgi:hypothetical protein